MKNLAVILIASLYLLGTLQVSVSLHYCGKKYKYFTINKIEERKSCCKGKMKMHGCCSDKEVLYKISDDQLSTSKYLVPIKTSIEKFITHTQIIAFNFIKGYTPEIYTVSHSPPLFKTVNLNILHCSFLI